MMRWLLGKVSWIEINEILKSVSLVIEIIQNLFYIQICMIICNNCSTNTPFYINVTFLSDVSLIQGLLEG